MIPLRSVGRGRSQEKVSSLEEGPWSPGVMEKLCGAPVGAAVLRKVGDIIGFMPTKPGSLTNISPVSWLYLWQKLPLQHC